MIEPDIDLEKLEKEERSKKATPAEKEDKRLKKLGLLLGQMPSQTRSKISKAMMGTNNAQIGATVRDKRFTCRCTLGELALYKALQEEIRKTWKSKRARNSRKVAKRKRVDPVTGPKS